MELHFQFTVATSQFNNLGYQSRIIATLLQAIHLEEVMHQHAAIWEPITAAVHGMLILGIKLISLQDLLQVHGTTLGMLNLTSTSTQVITVKSTQRCMILSAPLINGIQDMYGFNVKTTKWISNTDLNNVIQLTD